MKIGNQVRKIFLLIGASFQDVESRVQKTHFLQYQNQKRMIQKYPAPAAVIMQYTGLTQVTGNEPSTYACVGTKDNIASYRSVEYYIARLESAGTNAEVEVFKGLSHGFGLGDGTVAEGWIDHAVSFWEENSNT